MYTEFEKLPDHSRIWIYQSNRDLTSQEVDSATQALTSFCHSWTAHQQHLKTSFAVLHNRFVILATDEDYHLPSGCSIDSSVRALKEIQTHLGIDLFDRTAVAFLQNDRVFTLPLKELKQAFEGGKVDAKTITFNNLVPSKGDLKSGWKVPSETTWLARYITKPADLVQ